jgi:hydroxyethylthiazole kinase-like sugar kinase family protein
MKLTICTLAALLLLSLGALAADSKDQTLTGTVSDMMCGAHHTMMPGLADDQCTRACVKTGADYALVVGSKVYTLKGNKAEIDKFAGERATVKGTVSGNVIQATSITKPRK